MQHIRIACLFGIAAVLSACATGNLNKLKPAERKEQIVLTSEVSVKRQHGPFKINAENTAMPGVYIAAVQDEQGTYFLGKGKLMRIRTESTGVDAMGDGGIWVPFNASEPPRLFQTHLKEGQANTLTAANERSREIVSNMQMTQPVGASMSPVAAGVGGAIGGAIVGAIAESGFGDFLMTPPVTDPAKRQVVMSSIRPLAAPEAGQLK